MSLNTLASVLKSTLPSLSNTKNLVAGAPWLTTPFKFSVTEEVIAPLLLTLATSVVPFVLP